MAIRNTFDSCKIETEANTFIWLENIVENIKAQFESLHIENFISSGVARGGIQLVAGWKEEGEGRPKEELAPADPDHHEAQAQHGQCQGEEEDERTQRRL